MNYLEIFAKNVAIARKSKELSQGKLASLMGVSGPYVCALEKGGKNPSLKSIVKIADALGVYPGILFQSDDSDRNRISYANTKGLLENELLKWEGKKWYHQRFDGSPYLLHLIGEAETNTDRKEKGEFSFSVHYCFFEDGGADWYILQDDIDRVTDEFLTHIKDDEYFAERFIHRWQGAESALAGIFSDFRSLGWTKLTEEQLLEKNDLLLDAAVKRFSSSSIIDGFALGSDTILESRLKGIYKKKHGSDSGFPKFFSAITAPTHLSFINQAEVDLLVTAADIRKNLEKKESRITEYRDEYFWIRNNYIDAYDLSYEYFESEIMRLVVGDVDLERKAKDLAENAQIARKTKEKMMGEYHFDTLTLRMIDATDRFTRWQDERKRDTMLCSHFFVGILRDVARRTGISLDELKYLSPRELSTVFKDKSIGDGLALAKRCCVMYWTPEKFERVVGGEAVRRIRGRLFGTDAKTRVEDFRGMTASSGKAIGTARVLTSVKDMDKVMVGDILVAIMTRPDYIPAMKRAAAIVTNEGGITCHAAIVSRELGKPCIIGTKIATQVIKDGDLVEVNGNHGVVKIIRRA